MRARMLVAVALVAGAMLAGAGAATADATAPTNGGNGAGQSGQCTGNPVDRPAVCPAT